MMTARFERRQIDRWLVVLDAAAVAIFLLSVSLLVLDAYRAGFYEAAANPQAQAAMFWKIVRDIALLMISLGYFVTRHFRVAITRATNPWA